MQSPVFYTFFNLTWILYSLSTNLQLTQGEIFNVRVLSDEFTIEEHQQERWMRISRYVKRFTWKEVLRQRLLAKNRSVFTQWSVKYINDLLHRPGAEEINNGTGNDGLQTRRRVQMKKIPMDGRSIDSCWFKMEKIPRMVLLDGNSRECLGTVPWYCL